MPRVRPCRQCGKPCKLGGQSKRNDPLCIGCYQEQNGRDPRGRPRLTRPEPHPCPICGEVYQPRWRSPSKGGRWTEVCSQECGSRLAAQRRSAASPVPVRACARCGQSFASRDKRQRFCGRECRDAQQRLDRTVTWPSRRIWVVDCVECGRVFVGRSSRAKCCSDECRRKYGSRYTSEAIMRRYREDPGFRDLVISRAQNRRASALGLKGITNPATLISYLMERDHRRCGKCHKPIRAKKGPRRPSIGHIIPLARGGKHELANLQPEHLDCNLSAGADGGGGEQLLLVG